MLQRRIASTGVVYYASPLLESAGVPHSFSTRIGGLSPPPFNSLNLGNPSGCATQDDYERIYENYDRLQSVVGLSGRRRCWVHQVHGGTVADLRCGCEFVEGFKADAMVSDDADRVLSVRTADCVPVLLASADGTIVAAVHAGWRGVIAGVVKNALAALARSPTYSGERVGERGEQRRASVGARTPLAPFPNPLPGVPGRGNNVVAAIGPSIGSDAFEVGPEVIEQFERMFDGAAPIRRRADGRGYVDLREAIRLQLLRAGVSEDRIDTTDRCTFRDAKEFFSHRRDHGVTGRMASLISAKPCSSDHKGDTPAYGK